MQRGVLLTRLSTVYLLCIEKIGCYQFIKTCGINFIHRILRFKLQMPPEQSAALSSACLSFLALGALEHVSRYAVGCKALIGSEPHYWKLLGDILIGKEFDHVARTAIKILRRLRLFKIIDRFQVTTTYVVLSTIVNYSCHLNYDCTMPSLNFYVYVSCPGNEIKDLTAVCHDP